MKYITDTDYMPKYALNDPELCLLFYGPLLLKDIHDGEGCLKIIYRLLNQHQNIIRKALAIQWIVELDNAIEKINTFTDREQIIYIPFLHLKKEVYFAIRQFHTMSFLMKELIDENWKSFEYFSSDESVMEIPHPRDYFEKGIRGYGAYLLPFCKKNNVSKYDIFYYEMNKRDIDMSKDFLDLRDSCRLSLFQIYEQYHKADLPTLTEDKFRDLFSQIDKEIHVEDMLTEEGIKVLNSMYNDTRDLYTECFFENQIEGQEIDEEFNGIDIDSGDLLSSSKRKTQKTKFRDHTLLDFSTTMFYALKSFSRKIENDKKKNASKDNYYIKKYAYSICRCFIDELDDYGNKLYPTNGTINSTLYKNIMNEQKHDSHLKKRLKLDFEKLNLPTDDDLFE